MTSLNTQETRLRSLIELSTRMQTLLDADNFHQEAGPLLQTKADELQLLESVVTQLTALTHLRKPLGSQSKFQKDPAEFLEIIGQSSSLISLLTMVEKVAPTTAT